MIKYWSQKIKYSIWKQDQLFDGFLKKRKEERIFEIVVAQESDGFFKKRKKELVFKTVVSQGNASIKVF